MKADLRRGTKVHIGGLRTGAVLQSIVTPPRSLPMNAHGLTMQMRADDQPLYGYKHKRYLQF